MSSSIKPEGRNEIDAIIDDETEWLIVDKEGFKGGDIDSWLVPEIASNTPAFLQYTSGSTGIPKGVKVSHGNLLHNCQVMVDKGKLDQDSCFVSWLPPYHDMGLIGGILLPLFVGFHSVLMSPISAIQRPIKWLQAISDYNATVSGGPNFMYEACINRIRDNQLVGIDLSNWVVAFNGAEPISPSTVKRFHDRFKAVGFRSNAMLPCYGLAESTLMVTSNVAQETTVIRSFRKSALLRGSAEEIDPARTNTTDNRELISSGSFHDDLVVRIVDPDDFVVKKEGEIGEIWVHGRSVANGYWGHQQTANGSFGGQIRGEMGTYLRTGDLGFVKDGHLFVSGRLKDIIIINGKNHYPHDIERSASTSHEAYRVDACAAFSIEDNGVEKLVIMQETNKAFLNKDLSEAIEKLHHNVFMQNEISVFDLVIMKPGSVLKTSSGKIKHSACKEMYLNEYYSKNRKAV